MGEPNRFGKARAKSGITLALGAVLGVALIALVVHIAHYAFLCDDAFISFRYARNLADGYGLVFNPGGERVEGYSNFLWVLILAFVDLIGIAPEKAANSLSVSCSLALAIGLVLYCLQNRGVGTNPWWVLLPAALLATNRSYAVWSTSGLETRLFEMLCVGGLLRAIWELQLIKGGRGGSRPIAAALLALATLTRPDGMLISACVLGIWAFWPIVWQRFSLQRVVVGATVFWLPVGAHYLARYAYYGDWFPNTYYAKVGDAWWDIGGSYLAAFATEYAMVLWAPFVLAGIWGLIRGGRAEVAAILVATVAVHATYIASIGGDHFEYRPLDLYLLPIFVLMFYGAGWLSRAGIPTALIASAGAACVLGAAILPTLSGIDFPRGYNPGFPGLTPRIGGRHELVDSRAHAQMFSVPVLGGYLRHHNDQLSRLTKSFVGIRQEEHSAFLATARLQGRWLAELVEDGRLPADTHIAVCCVGAIPYISGLRTLDRLGLTDRNVAHGPDNSSQIARVMAHEKRADYAYAKTQGVDLWAIDELHVVLPAEHPTLQFVGYRTRSHPEFARVADVGQGRWLVAFPTQGPDDLIQRIPNLDFVTPEFLFKPRDVKRSSPTGYPLGPFGGPYHSQYAQFSNKLGMLGDKEGARIFMELSQKSRPRLRADGRRNRPR
jgi:arabinofuranosyltransferase